MRRALVTVLIVVMWGLFVARGILRLNSNIDDIAPWLPEKTHARQTYEWFVDTFGSDDMVIVSWEDCQLGDPRIEVLADALRRDNDGLIREVIVAQSIIDEVMDKSSLSRDEAVERLTGFLIGPDGHATCLLVYLTREGMRDRRRAVETVITRALEQPSVSRDSLRMGGRPYLGYYTAQLTTRSIVQLSIPVVILSTVLAWFAFGDLATLVTVMGASACAAVTSLALVPWLGFEVSGLLTALPSLVIVIATSGSIHLANYAMILATERPPLAGGSARVTPAGIRQMSWKPCLLSSASTALGTLSLVWSEFSAIRDFGMFATLGVMITYLMHMGLMPWLFSQFITAHIRPRPVLLRMVMACLKLVLRYRRTVVITTLLVTAALIVPLFRLEGRFQIDELFSKHSSFVRQASWLEDNLGPVDATEVVVGLEKDTSHGFLHRSLVIQELARSLTQLDDVASSYSAVTMLPETARSSSVLARGLARVALEQSRDRLLQGAYLAETDTHEYWRITLRTSLFGDVDRDQLRTQILTVIADTARNWERRPVVHVTGASQVFEESKDDVLGDFIESLFLAYALILLLLVLAMRSVVAGLLAMIPNIIPCVAVFGLLGLIDGAVDMGMTVAACIALGIAVDDTSHLLMSFRDCSPQHSTRAAALVETFQHNGPAMVETSLVCGISLTPYLWAELLYLSRFGLLLPVLMAAALVGDLVFLPAILAVPSGRWFAVSLSHTNSSADVLES
ncbi:MAG: RND family transporter [Thermomicrobiales bacterium]